jgi:hypothetical protein
MLKNEEPSTGNEEQPMTTASFEQRLQTLLGRKPFQPFVIELEDGEHWVVGQREALMYQDGGTAIYFRLDGSFDFVDSHNVRQMLELTIVPST